MPFTEPISAENTCPTMQKMHKYSPRLFYKHYWQQTEGVCVKYLTYRLSIAVFLVALCIASFLGVEEEEDEKTQVQRFKWFIYLTNWGFLLCTIQCLLGAYISLTRFLTIRKNKALQDGDAKMTKLLRIYWLCQNISVPTSFAITIIYWTAVYNPELDTLTIMTFVVHGLNSLLMLLDMIVVAHPFFLIHFLYTLLFVIIYSFFSAVYFFAGGTDRLNRRYIYEILDWGRPARSIVVVLITTSFLFFLHILTWLLSIYKIHLKEKKFLKTCTIQASSNHL